MLLGVKGKVLEIDSKKILRPDPGLYSQYISSYAIFKHLARTGGMLLRLATAKKCHAQLAWIC